MALAVTMTAAFTMAFAVTMTAAFAFILVAATLLVAAVMTFLRWEIFPVKTFIELFLSGFPDGEDSA